MLVTMADRVDTQPTAEDISASNSDVVDSGRALVRVAELTYALSLLAGGCVVGVLALSGVVVRVLCPTSAWARGVVNEGLTALERLSSAWPALLILLSPLFYRALLDLTQRVTKVGSAEFSQPMYPSEVEIATTPTAPDA